MPTKLGFQLHDGSDTQRVLDRLKGTHPAAIVVLHNIDLMNAVYDVLGAGPVYVYQRYGMEDAETYIAKHGSIVDAVNQFIDDVKPLLESLRWTYHCTFTANAITPELAQFEALAIKLVHEQYNARLCIGNFAPGTPEPENWEVYRPALDAAARYNAIVGLRELYPIVPYAGYGVNANIPDANAATPRKLRNEIPYPQVMREPGQIVGRYRHLRDYCRQQKLPVRMLITEIGAGRVLPDWMDAFGANLGHWQTLDALWGQFGFGDSAAHYFQDLSWMDQHVYVPDEEVIGACIYAWNTPGAPGAEIGDSSALMNALQGYIQTAGKDQPLGYKMYPLPDNTQFTVAVTRVRIRAIPSMNTKYIGGFDYGEVFTGTHYAFTDGMLWIKHHLGWTAYAPLLNGNPDYDNKYLDGMLITTPRQDSAVNNFVGTLAEVRAFLQAHQDNLFYISINPETPPDGARRFNVTTFPVQVSRQIINQLHPAPGDPLMTPGAKRKMRDAGQL